VSYDVPVRNNPDSCEILALIHFIQAKNMIAAEIYRELYAAVYGRNAMNEATVRQW
jgi:hypothetical protein